MEDIFSYSHSEKDNPGPSLLTRVLLRWGVYVELSWVTLHPSGVTNCSNMLSALWQISLLRPDCTIDMLDPFLYNVFKKNSIFTSIWQCRSMNVVVVNIVHNCRFVVCNSPTQTSNSLWLPAFSRRERRKLILAHHVTDCT